MKISISYLPVEEREADLSLAVLLLQPVAAESSARRRRNRCVENFVPLDGS